MLGVTGLTFAPRQGCACATCRLEDNCTSTHSTCTGHNVERWDAGLRKAAGVRIWKYRKPLRCSDSDRADGDKGQCDEYEEGVFGKVLALQWSCVTSPMSRGSSLLSAHLAAGIVAFMNVVQAIERGLRWLSTPRYLPGRLEMQTQRGKRLEMEIVSFAIRIPFPGGAVVSIPVFMTIMPAGSSPIEGSQIRPEDHKA